jgi:hypothetical protein
MKIGLLVFLVGFGCAVMAQEILPQGYDTLFFKQELRVEGMGYHHSSHLRNDFTGSFLFGGMISDEIKERSMPRIEENGRIGGEVNGEIIYRDGQPLFQKWSNIGWQAKFGSYQQFGAGFTSDAFGLIMHGNERYLGEDAVLSNTAGFALGFHKIGFGLLDRSKKHSLTVNMLLGTNMLGFDVNRGILAFDESGESIDYNADVTLRSANGNATVFNGIGVAIDFEIFAAIEDVPGLQGVFQVAGRNIGFMHHASVTEWNFSGAGTFNGFSIGEFSELLTYTDGQMNMFLDSLGFSRTSGSRTALIPGGFIQAGKIVSQDVVDKFQSFFGIRVLTNLIHKPMVYGGGHYDFSDWGNAGLQVAFGGYGGFRLGGYFGANYKQLSFGLGTEDLLGLGGAGFFGRSVITRLIWKFD